MLEVVGGDATGGHDSVSLVPDFAEPDRASLRDVVYAGLRNPPGYYGDKLHLRAVRGERFKLMSVLDVGKGIDSTQMYDLRLDPFELVDLLQAPLSAAAEAAYPALAQQLAALTSPWSLLEGALAGTHGLPTLLGAGTLLAGETVCVGVARALAGAQAFLVVGSKKLSAPFKGGLLVPDPSALVLPIVIDPAGQTSFDLPWPQGVPAGFELYLQTWIVDRGGVSGFAATNGLQLVAP